jgi:hypothetical protein
MNSRRASEDQSEVVGEGSWTPQELLLVAMPGKWKVRESRQARPESPHWAGLSSRWNSME